MAREATEAKKQAFYILGMEEMQARLTEELAEVYRDYCNATWDEALNVARVPADSALRQPGSIYYHPDIHEVPGAIPPPRAIPSPFALVLEASKQSLVAQTALPPPEVLKRSSETGDQGQGAEGAKEKGKGKGTRTKPPLEAKDATKAKEAEAKAKEVEAKTKEADPKANDAPTTQQSLKEAPLPPKTKA